MDNTAGRTGLGDRGGGAGAAGGTRSRRPWPRPWWSPASRRRRPLRPAAATPAQGSGDPRTTYRSGVGLHELLPSSKLITLENANRHGLHGEYGNACVDDEVNDYWPPGSRRRRNGPAAPLPPPIDILALQVQA
ncbi:alpha/beta hydrolase [Streptomyces erythrochromogenes]|uniref:alpha/beta hydrolase n=1 Tax=Streptomyces erythrochromogenes TaxID=285574 RepID=UPI00382B0CE3